MVIGEEIYLLRTDFRAGIEYQREVNGGKATAASLFSIMFRDRWPEDVDEALEALCRFYRRKDEPVETTATGPTAYDLDVDADAICADFMREYGIDLTTAEMHWWRFMALLEGLYGVAFDRRVEIRTKDLSGMTSKERAPWLKARNHFSLDQQESTEDHLAFLDRIIAEHGGGGDG